jgi:O-antigen/teichoic acid export membrane protein
VRLGQKIALNASALAFGRLATAALGVLGVGLTTRYLGVGSYGQLVAATAFVGISSTLSDLGLWTIGVRELAKRPDEKHHLIGGLLTVGFILSTLSALITVGTVFLIYPGAENELLREAVLLMALVPLPFAAPAAAIAAYLYAEQKGYWVMIANVGSSLVLVVLLGCAVVFDWGFTGVALAYAAFPLSYGLILVAYSIGRVRLRPSLDPALSKQLVRWALPVGGTYVVASLYWRIDIVLLSILSSEPQVALYGLAYKVVDPLVAMPQYIVVTLFPEYARAAHRRDRLSLIMQKGFAVIQVGTVPLFVFCVIFANEIVEVLGGNDFADATPVLQILMIGVASAYFNAIYGRVLVALDQQSWELRIALTLLPVNVLLNLALIPLWGARGAAVAFAASEILSVAMTRAICARFVRGPRLQQAPRVAAAALGMAVVGLAKMAPFASVPGPIVVLTVGAVVTFAVYAGVLYLLNAMPREIHTNLVLPVLARLKMR